MAMIDVSLSFAGSDTSFSFTGLDALFLESSPAVTRQRSKLEPDDYEAPGAPMRLPVRMPSLEEGEIREDAEDAEEVVEPMRSMATPACLLLAYAEAAAREFARRCESEVQHHWNWDPVQQRFVLV